MSETEIKNKIRKAYEESVINLISNPDYVEVCFYGFILTRLHLVIDKNFPTLGVSYNSNLENYQLIIGEYFLNLNKDERIAVLIHEASHIVLGHIWRKEERDHELFNIAADVAINQYIDNLPNGALYPETFQLPKNNSAEYYYETLKNETKRNNKKIKKVITIDDHSQWNNKEYSSEEKELIKSVTENIIKKAIESSRGNLPSNIDEILEIYSNNKTISWKKILRKYLKKKGKKIYSIKRKNKRFQNRDDLKGTKKEYDKVNIIVGLDVSGSMTDEIIIEFLSELKELVKTQGNITLIQADTEIKNISILNNPNQLKFFKRKGNGGTYLGNIPNYIINNKLNTDVLIMFTDGYIEDINNDKNWLNFKKPVLWILPKKYTDKKFIEQKININKHYKFLY